MFHVRWKLTALNELAALWMQADTALRARITQAANTVDAGLRHDPYALSESRSGLKRIAFFLPLSVVFELDRKNHLVTVLHVNLVRSRKK